MSSSRFHQSTKRHVWDFAAKAFDPATRPDAALGAHCAADFELHASHPVNLLKGPEAVVEGYLQPLRGAFPDLSRRTVLFFAEDSPADGWVTAVGNYFGVFCAPLFGIPPTGRPAYMRFGEFWRVEEGEIQQCYVMLDLLELARQSGVFPLRAGLGQDVLVPGPATQDGILTGPADPAETKKSFDLVLAMIEGLMRYDPADDDFSVMAHADFWRPDFMWYGPSGIGTTRGIDGFIAGHQRLFLTAFPDRKGVGHRAELAEGAYAATFGWPSLGATHAGGGWLGLAPTGKRVQMRVMDWWRREGDLLAENWVLIDIPDVLCQLGMDPFADTCPPLGTAG